MKRLFASFFLLYALTLSGCTNDAAKHSMEQIRKSAENGRSQKNATILALVDAIAARDHARADELADDAKKSATKADGSINAAVADAIHNKRIQDYAAIEAYSVKLRQRVLDSDADFQNINAYVDAMQGYFQNKQSQADTFNAAAESGLKIFDALLTKHNAKIPIPGK